jgi:hypothetical protein
MLPLSPQALIQAWEWGQDQHVVDRGLLLLRLALPGIPQDTLAAFSIGQRNLLLIQLRKLTLGPQLACVVICPRCSSKQEFAVDADELGVAQPAEQRPERYEVRADGFLLHFRLPNSRDLAAVVGLHDLGTARQRLLQNCLIRASYEQASVLVEQLPAQAVAVLVDKMSEFDPGAELRFRLECDTCLHEWATNLDIVAFFFTEISIRAQQLLYEVHMLARAYGWREADILSMSAVRRRYYLRLV